MWPEPRSAHAREKGARNADKAEDVGLEDGQELLFGGLFDGASEAEAGVVDEYVDGGEAGMGLGDDGGDLRGVGDVERVGLGLAGVLLFEVGDFIEGARGGDDLVALAEELLCEQAAKAGGGAGDEPDFRLMRGGRISGIGSCRRSIHTHQG